MKLLCRINESDLAGIEPKSNNNPITSRKAARAIIFNGDNKIALLYASRDGYHKLPGGGIEGQESWQEALEREALEEVGCQIKIRPIEIGVIEEVRQSHAMHQLSYCGIADACGEPFEPQLTADEISDGISPKWASLDEAINLLESDKPQGYVGHFIKARDLAFLREAKKLLVFK